MAQICDPSQGRYNHNHYGVKAGRLPLVVLFVLQRGGSVSSRALLVPRGTRGCKWLRDWRMVLCKIF